MIFDSIFTEKCFDNLSQVFLSCFYHKGARIRKSVLQDIYMVCVRFEIRQYSGLKYSRKFKTWRKKIARRRRRQKSKHFREQKTTEILVRFSVFLYFFLYIVPKYFSSPKFSPPPLFGGDFFLPKTKCVIYDNCVWFPFF